MQTYGIFSISQKKSNIHYDNWNRLVILVLISENTYVINHIFLVYNSK